MEFLHAFFQSRAGNHYLYDAVTNRIFQISELLYTHRSVIFGALENKRDLFKLYKDPAYESIVGEYVKIENALKQGDISRNTINSVNYSFSFGDLLMDLNDSMQHLTLCITEECNLRCDYCTYSGHYLYARKHSNRSMTYDTAIKAVDFYNSHSMQSKKMIVSFYGGEPLLEFDKIKKIVSYCKNIFSGKECHYQITTNGTLLNDSFIDWFIENPDVYINVTLNGTEAYHDLYRHTSEGIGSHRLLLNSLERIIDKNRDVYTNRVNFLCNYLTISDIPDIMHFYKREETLQGKTPLFITGVNDTDHDGFLPVLKSKRHTEEDTFAANSAYDKLVEMYCNDADNSQPILKLLFDHSLLPIHRRQPYTGSEKVFFGGICAPFTQRLFVNTAGTFNLCEKVGDYCDYGNVHDGFNLNKIKELLLNYKNAHEGKCSSCWAVRLCSLCFIDAFASDVIDTNRRDRLCIRFMENLIANLSLYCSLKESSQSVLDYLDKYTYDI